MLPCVLHPEVQSCCRLNRVAVLLGAGAAIAAVQCVGYSHGTWLVELYGCVGRLAPARGCRAVAENFPGRSPSLGNGVDHRGVIYTAVRGAVRLQEADTLPNLQETDVSGVVILRTVSYSGCGDLG